MSVILRQEAPLGAPWRLTRPRIPLRGLRFCPSLRPCIPLGCSEALAGVSTVDVPTEQQRTVLQALLRLTALSLPICDGAGGHEHGDDALLLVGKLLKRQCPPLACVSSPSSPSGMSHLVGERSDFLPRCEEAQGSCGAFRAACTVRYCSTFSAILDLL